MKRIFLLIVLALTAQTTKAQTVVLDANGVTVKWIGGGVVTPYFVQANPRGTMEWFAIVDDYALPLVKSYANDSQWATNFTPPGSSTPIPFDNIVTTLVTDMRFLFYASAFNQPIGSWDVSNVTDMDAMFYNTSSFNQSLDSWDVSNVTDMSFMFSGATAFNQPIGSWNVSNVINMQAMFQGSLAFNQPIGSWNVMNVTNMSAMLSGSKVFNQPIGSWNVMNVTDMSTMFQGTLAFNQPIGSWNVSNVTYMDNMFGGSLTFNQPIGSWNVNNVTNMSNMFYRCLAFNQNIGFWNVSNVTDMSLMFSGATAFNQPIGSWNVSNVTNMDLIFSGGQLSTANYDALLIGWSTVDQNETPLQPNVTFYADNSNYCNGASARNSIIQNYGWTIYDGGLNCNLSTETFDAIGLKLYPNPVLSVLNVTVDSNFISQPYSIVDGLGRVVLSGNLNEGDNSINVEHLSKGIYYLKVSDNNASKFIKE